MKKAAMVVAAALFAASLNVVLVSPALAIAVQGSQLPGVDASGASLPLKPEQLTAEEKAAYDKLPPGSDDARKFLYTRGFLRYSQMVVDGSLQPSQLPGLPAESNWDRKFLTATEAVQIVDVALGRSMVSEMRTDLPQPLELVLLTADQLDTEEKAAFAKLSAGSNDARRFLYTRSFLRPCKQVVDRRLEPARLPDLPKEEDWDRKFLSEFESKQVVDICLGMSMMAMMK